MTSDGHLGIAGSADSTAVLWDLNTYEAIRRYHKGSLTELFAPDNRTVLIWANDISNYGVLMRPSMNSWHGHVPIAISLN